MKDVHGAEVIRTEAKVRGENCPYGRGSWPTIVTICKGEHRVRPERILGKSEKEDATR